MTATRCTPLSRGLLASFLFTFAFFALGFSADKKSFDIPAGTADKSLKLFTAQAGAEVVYPAEIVRGVKTPAIKGEMLPEEAIRQLLADSPLRVKQDEKNMTFMISRDPNAQRVALNKVTTPKKQVEIEDGKVVMDTYTVTGSRVQGVLGEIAAQPVLTYTRKDLDRLGVRSVEDLNRYIPQLPPVDWTTQPETAAGFATGRQNLGNGLRGLGNTATLVLVNGRRVAKLGQASGVDAYDLAGVPMAAVERIEVLTDGASAIYGADALAGVVNIILKKQYSGTELAATYANTFDTDTGYREVQLTHGLHLGKTSLMLTASWSKSNSLAPRDRWFSASNDRRAFGGADNRSAVPDGRGQIRTVSGANLPGLSSPVAAIPAGSDGRNLTIADYANAGAVADRFDQAQYLTYGNRRFKSLHLTSEYNARSWLQLFVDGTWSEAVTYMDGAIRLPEIGRNAFTRISLPAGYPGNPFGVPIFVDRVFWELKPLLDRSTPSQQSSVSVGARGSLSNAWKYEAGIQWSRTKYIESTAGTFNLSFLQAAVNNQDTSKNPILLNDGLASSPNAENLMRTFFQEADTSMETPGSWLYDFRVDGPAWSLPAGEVRVALGVEVNEDYARFSEPLPSFVNSRLRSVSKRLSMGTFVEAVAPLISDHQHIPLVHRLELGMAARRDDYSDFGSKTVPRVSVLYRPAGWLAVRATYGEGYKVPLLFQLNQPVSESTGTLPSVRDTLRNGEALSYSFAFRRGGNPGLRPEQSENLNMGVVVELPFIKKLSFSADYYDLRHTDRTSEDLQAIFDYFPERVTRATPTDADRAAGLPGRVMFFDRRAVNIAYLHTSGWDLELRYQRALGSWGEAFFRVAGSIPTDMEIRNAPGATLSNELPKQRWRSVGTAAWSRGGFELGATASYDSAYMGLGRPGFAGVPFPSTLVWDAQASCDFARLKAPTNRRLRGISSGLRLNLNVYNITGRDPFLYRGSVQGDVDPRGRRFQIKLTKQL